MSKKEIKDMKNRLDIQEGTTDEMLSKMPATIIRKDKEYWLMVEKDRDQRWIVSYQDDDGLSLVDITGETMLFCNETLSTAVNQMRTRVNRELYNFSKDSIEGKINAALSWKRTQEESLTNVVNTLSDMSDTKNVYRGRLENVKDVIIMLEGFLS